MTWLAIAVEYVRASTLKIHAKPSDDAPVVTTWQHGESVSILSRLESDTHADAAALFASLAVEYLADTRDGNGRVSTPLYSNVKEDS